MDFSKLFEMQAALDRHIEKQHGLENIDLAKKKIMALLVEVGELANETRCFKFWSKKPASPDEKVLEEYVDGIHFLLSLGIMKQYQSVVPDTAEQMEHDLTSQFLKVFQAINLFHGEQTAASYSDMFAAYLELGLLLGFDGNDIERAYTEKNAVNFERQEQGY
ncbi:dUTPase [Peribacillus saganii]|uniref:dUTPase n=1 Tax=Peribacillus saganii TaxID=2303992 RepID=A0A372LR55_9BACI|nr:dUTP diphosphatase [Peribacillus saganii]RFU70713.1 dUTPase [Peribacillus saganii]